MKEYYFIIMADIIKNRNYDGKVLMESFKKLINTTNREYHKSLLSPLTITIGDEFQGICQDLPAATALILFIEENIISEHYGFKLRYVIYYGKIDTPINHEIAYGMLGEGLTKARAMLSDLKSKSFTRFELDCDNQKVEINKSVSQLVGKSYYLKRFFLLILNIIDDWHEKDYAILKEFFEDERYSIVAEKLNKNQSLIWKRKNSLKIRDYHILKNLIQDMATSEWLPVNILGHE